MTKRVPFDGMDPVDIKEKVLRGDHALDIGLGLQRDIQGLIDSCRQYSPNDRPSFMQIFSTLNNI